MSVNLATELAPEAIRIGVQAHDWREALTAAGQALTDSGATTAHYTDEMIAAVEEHGPYIVVAPHIALAHSRPSPAVLRTGISWVTLAEPIDFGNAQNDPVTLVIGLAAVDHDGHMQLLASLAALLADPQKLAVLLGAQTPDELRTHLREYAEHTQNQ